MAFWLLKTEPQEYSWEMLERDGKTLWTGIRNAQAKNNIAQMQPGDFAFIYHTGEEKLVAGIAKVMAAPEVDPTEEKGKWLAIQLVAHRSIMRPVSLEEIRNTHGLSVMPLVAQPRLSVHPVTEEQAHMLLKIGKTEI